MLTVNNAIDEIVENYKNILGINLVGIYLHGSAAMGCFNPESSDLDFLIVIKGEISKKVKRELVEVLLKLSSVCSIKGFEMSAVLLEDAVNFKYPTPFVLHYSNCYKKRYMDNVDFICGNSVDWDLAAHFVVTRHRGICLFGKQIKDVFSPVKYEYYLDSIVRDIANAREIVRDEPVYMILNLCRVLCYLRDKKICSKKEGGEWGYSNLPVEFNNIVNSALSAYIDSSFQPKFDERELIVFADYMLKEIEKRQVYFEEDHNEQL